MYDGPTISCEHWAELGGHGPSAGPLIPLPLQGCRVGGPSRVNHEPRGPATRIAGGQRRYPQPGKGAKVTSLGVRDAQAVPSGCDLRWVTPAGPCLSLPTGSRENKCDMGWELCLPWGRESSPSPAFPCPIPEQHAPAGGTPACSLQEKRRKQLGGSCSFSSHPASSPTVRRRTRCHRPVQAYAHGRLHTHELTSVCTHTKARGAFMPADTRIHMHAQMHTCGCAHAQPLPDGTRAPCRATSCARAAVGRHRQPRLLPKAGSPIAQGHGGAPRGTQTLRAELSCGPQAQRVGTTEPGAAGIHRAATWHLPPARPPEHRCWLSGWITAVTSSSTTFP